MEVTLFRDALEASNVLLTPQRITRPPAQAFRLLPDRLLRQCYRCRWLINGPTYGKAWSLSEGLSIGSTVTMVGSSCRQRQCVHCRPYRLPTCGTVVFVMETRSTQEERHLVRWRAHAACVTPPPHLADYAHLRWRQGGRGCSRLCRTSELLLPRPKPPSRSSCECGSRVSWGESPISFSPALTNALRIRTYGCRQATDLVPGAI